MTTIVAKKTGKHQGKNTDRLFDRVEKLITARFGKIIPIPESERHTKQKFVTDCLVCNCEGTPEPIRFIVEPKTRSVYILDNNDGEIIETLK